MAEHREIQLRAQGRLVIPAALRKALGFAPGDVLVARRENERLVLEKASSIKRRLRERFARVPAEVSLAEELIAERREEGKRESDA